MGEAYNVMAATCPSRTVLHRIGARWTVFVVNALDEGPRRFTELKAHIQGITPKGADRDVAVAGGRRPDQSPRVRRNPPRVEYALTPLGRSLLVPLRAVRQWAEGARARYRSSPGTRSRT